MHTFVIVVCLCLYLFLFRSHCSCLSLSICSCFIVIAKRRIGHTSHRVSEFIMNTDLDGLLSEHCELLLKFIPTEEEVTLKLYFLCGILIIMTL